MKLRTILCGVIAAVVLAVVTVRAQSNVPGDCPNDSKLLNGGPTAVEGDEPGTWWALVLNGLNAAGFSTDVEKLSYLNGLFGTDFTTLDEMKEYNLGLVSAGYDLNGNGYVCAFELRGTRAYAGDPLINTTTFGISDDRVSRK